MIPAPFVGGSTPGRPHHHKFVDTNLLPQQASRERPSELSVCLSPSLPTERLASPVSPRLSWLVRGHLVRGDIRPSYVALCQTGQTVVDCSFLVSLFPSHLSFLPQNTLRPDERRRRRRCLQWGASSLLSAFVESVRRFSSRDFRTTKKTRDAPHLVFHLVLLCRFVRDAPTTPIRFVRDRLYVSPPTEQTESASRNNQCPRCLRRRNRRRRNRRRRVRTHVRGR